MDDPAVIATILLAAVAALLLLARVADVPYPVVLFVGGTGLGFVPGLPELTLDPEVLLLGILPPLFFAAVAPASLRELRDRARGWRERVVTGWSGMRGGGLARGGAGGPRVGRQP